MQGEGEIATNSSVLFYNHTRAVFRALPGAGSRGVVIRAGGQLPAASQRYTMLRYSDPVITTLAGRGQLSTNGGDPLDIFGLSFAPPTVNMFANSTAARAIYFPQPLPDSAVMLPTVQLRVDFGSPFRAMPCVASAYAASGALAPGFGNCLPQGVGAVTLGAASDATADRITMVVPPGVGRNKPITVTYVAADGSVLTRSNVANFTYDPPMITSMVSLRPPRQRGCSAPAARFA